MVAEETNNREERQFGETGWEEEECRCLSQIDVRDYIGSRSGVWSRHFVPARHKSRKEPRARLLRPCEII